MLTYGLNSKTFYCKAFLSLEVHLKIVLPVILVPLVVLILLAHSTRVINLAFQNRFLSSRTENLSYTSFSGPAEDGTPIPGSSGGGVGRKNK